MREEYLDIERGIASELLHAQRRLLQRGAQILEAQNISIGQAAILKILKEKGPMTQRELAAETRVTPATICGTLKRMEKAGLINRETAESDGRATNVSLTEDGTVGCKNALAAIRHIHEEMLTGFTDEECELFQQLIRRMGDNLLRAIEANTEGCTDEDR